LREQKLRIVAVLESWFLEALHCVIERRVRWLIAEHRFRFSVEYIQMVRNAPGDLQAQLQTFFWDEFGFEYDPEGLYRQR
jgi:predicted metal-dependent hydrolase